METKPLETIEDALEELQNNPEAHARNTFAHDVVNKYHAYGRLTPAQLAALIRSLERGRKEAATPKGNAPTGRQTVTGEVVSVKEHTGKYGTSLKMTVRLENNSRVWVTVPKGFDAAPGKSVTFTATFERSDKDPSFAFGKRPELVAFPAEWTPVTKTAAVPEKPMTFKTMTEALAELTELDEQEPAPGPRSILDELLDAHLEHERLNEKVA